MSDQNKSIVTRWVERGFNGRDMAEFDIYYSPDLVDHALPPGLPPGREGRKLFAGAFFSAFPDVHLHVEDLIAEGDTVVARWSAHGTHLGDLMGIPATGKPVNITGVAIDRFENGQAVELWEVIDQLGLMQQLGVIPS